MLETALNQPVDLNIRIQNIVKPVSQGEEEDR